MTPNEALQFYVALRLHFTSDYDCFKYNFKIRNKVDYTKRKDKFQLQKIAKHNDPQGLILSNVSNKPNIWAGDIVSDDGMKVYNNWLRRKESLAYTFSEEIKKFGNITEAFKITDHQHPKALRLYIGEKISLETLVILNTIASPGYYDHWNKELQGDLVWKEMWLKIPKYAPFVKYDKKKFKEIIKENLS